MEDESRICYKTVRKRIDCGEGKCFKEIKTETPCEPRKKKRCPDGVLQYDTKDGRKKGDPCKDDGRSG